MFKFRFIIYLPVDYTIHHQLGYQEVIQPCYTRAQQRSCLPLLSTCLFNHDDYFNTSVVDGTSTSSIILMEKHPQVYLVPCSFLCHTIVWSSSAHFVLTRIMIPIPSWNM